MFKTPEQLFGIVMTNPNQIKREQKILANALIGLTTELIALKKEKENENDILDFFSSKINESQEKVLNVDYNTLVKDGTRNQEYEDFFKKYEGNLTKLILYLLKNKDKFTKTATIGYDSYDMFKGKIDKTKDKDVFIGKSDDVLSKNPNDFYQMSFETKRALNQKSTDFVSNQILSTKNKYFHFIVSSLQLLIDIVKKIPEISANFTTIDIIMKGGNLLKLFFDRMSKDFNHQINNYLQHEFAKNFSSSDFDLDFIFKPNKDIDLTLYHSQRVFVSNLITIYMIYLRDIIFKNKDYFFDFYNLNQKAQEKHIKHLIEEYNKALKTIVADDIEYSKTSGKPRKYIELDGAKIVSVIYDYDQPKTSYISYTEPGEKPISTDFIKNDYCVINDSSIASRHKSDNEFYIIRYAKYLSRFGIDINASELADIKNSITGNSNNFYYNTSNININFADARFSLFRIKVNFIGKIKFANNTEKLIQMPGELLDLSLAKNNDYKLLHSKPEFYTNFFINSIVRSITTQSIEGLINELIVMLFIETSYKPWIDIKYDKRLIRVIVLITLKLLYNKDNIPFIDKINLCEKVLDSINNNFTDLNLNTNEINLFTGSFSYLYVSFKETNKNNSDSKFPEFMKILTDTFGKMIKVLKVHYMFSLKKGNIHMISYLDGF